MGSCFSKPKIAYAYGATCTDQEPSPTLLEYLTSLPPEQLDRIAPLSYLTLRLPPKP